MAVKVIVKGDKNGDYNLIGADAKPARILGTEVLEIFDVQQRILYSVPYKNIRFIEGVNLPVEEIPQALTSDKKVVVHMEVNPHDDMNFQADGVDFAYFINSVIVHLLVVTGFDENKRPIVNRGQSIPLDNIRYIDFNIPVQKNQTNKPKTTDKNPQKPSFKQKPNK